MDGPIAFDPASNVPGSNLKWNISATNVGHLLAGNCYLNVHTTAHPGGEIRGQLRPAGVGGIATDPELDPLAVEVTAQPSGGSRGLVAPIAAGTAAGLALLGGGAAWVLRRRRA
jgi:LPXTG-motif cell wall-anchored protein